MGATMKNGAFRYKHIIFDADDTLLRYRDDERGAFLRLFSQYNVVADEQLLNYSNAVSEEIWTETGLYDVHSPVIQREYHALYRAHIERVFEKIIVFLKQKNVFLSPKITPQRMRDEFLCELQTGGNLVDGAKQTLAVLKERGYKISIATNGLSAIQLGRTMPLQGLFDGLFVSEALGAIKPTGEFFERLLSLLNAEKKECLFVGDSLSSDIEGANQAGICCCLFDPQGKYRAICNKTERAAPNYVIEKLPQLLDLL